MNKLLFLLYYTTVASVVHCILILYLTRGCVILLIPEIMVVTASVLKVTTEALEVLFIKERRRSNGCWL